MLPLTTQYAQHDTE